jgi:E3 ubiquitin-protein ligase RNF115/126
MFKGKIKKSQVVPIVFCKNVNAFSEKRCPICVKDFNKDHVVLPCGHIFHSDCILSWFEKKMDCPICRIKVQWSHVLSDETHTSFIKNK